MGETRDRREAIVLAGGLGSRLASVLPDRQKVTASVGGQPFALRLAEWLGVAGVERIIFAAGHRAADVQALLDLRTDGPAMELSIEPEPLGTAGAVRFALERTDVDPILVLNGDSFVDVDLDQLYAFHRRCGAGATLALAPEPEPGRYGVVDVAASGEVLSFAEKPLEPGRVRGWINAGVYLFRREAILNIPMGRPVSLEREVFPAMTGNGLFGMTAPARFIDIGTPASYAAAADFFGAAGQ